MKRIIYCLLTAGLIISLSQCSDPCEDVNCNSGTCDEGICECFDGFTGTNCDQEIRAKFFGTFQGVMECPDAPIDLSMVGFGELVVIIEADENDIHGVKISTPSLPLNLFENATVDGNDFTLATTETELDLSNIPDLPIEIDNITVTTTGNGTLVNENQIDVNVNIIIPFFGTTSCSASLQRI